MQMNKFRIRESCGKSIHAPFKFTVRILQWRIQEHLMIEASWYFLVLEVLPCYLDINRKCISLTNQRFSGSCKWLLFCPTKQQQHSAPAVPATHHQTLETSSSADREEVDLGGLLWPNNSHLHCRPHEELANCPICKVAAHHPKEHVNWVSAFHERKIDDNLDQRENTAMIVVIWVWSYRHYKMVTLDVTVLVRLNHYHTICAMH